MNNTIQTIDTTMQEPTQFDLNSIFIAALTQAITQATAPLVARIATLEEQMIAKQDNIDERIKEIAEEVADAKMAEHTDEYDHDGYDRLEERIDDKISEAVDDLDISDKINDALNGATVSISV